MAARPSLRRALALLLACAPVACQDQAPLVPGAPVGDGKGPLPVLPQPPAVAADSGKLLLAASTGVLGGPDGRMALSVSVTARNATAQALSLADVCVVQVRAFAGGSGVAPRWALPRLTANACPPGSREVPAGGRYWLQTSDVLPPLPLTGLDGTPLLEGDYRFDALVRIGADTVAVPAGTLRLPGDLRLPLRDPHALTYAVDTRLEGYSPRALVTRVGATNATDRSVYLEYGACSLALRAYRTPDRTGVPVWRSETARPPGYDGPIACLTYLATRLLTPGAGMRAPEHTLSVPVAEILGDTLPDGRYYFTAVLTFVDAGGSGQADTVRLLAGDALLTSQVDPLPAEVEVGGLRYAAATAPDPSAPGSFRLSLTVTNLGATRALLLGWNGITCNSQLAGYSTAERRDRWYFRRSADVGFAGCPIALSPAWLAPGEARTYTATAAPPAGARGRYYLLLFLWADLEPPADVYPTRIVLAAGDVMLGS